MMKKFIASIALCVIALASVSAQDLAQVTEIYNSGATALSEGNKTEALSAFEQALSLAEALGDEGKEIAENCKGVIPDIHLSIAKELVSEAKYDEAVAKLNTAVEVAGKYNDDAVVAEATELIPQVIMRKGGELINSKQYAEAAEAYKQVLELEPTNGVAALRLGIALSGEGKSSEAKEALKLAIENGQEAQAKKQLANVCLKDALASLKSKNYNDAIDSALENISYAGDNATAYQIAGQAAQQVGKYTDAIGYFEKYLELAPTAKNAGQIAFTVGALYQQQKNNAKAKEYFAKAVNDPKYGADAKKLLEALK